MQKHVNILATVYVASSILFLLIGGILLLLVLGVAGLTQEPIIVGLARVAAGIIGAFLFLLALAGILVGIGLHRRRSWARITAVVLSILNLFNFPVGTLIGGYGLWVTLHPQTVSLFQREYGERRSSQGGVS